MAQRLEYFREYYQKNKELIAEKGKKYRDDKKEEINKRRKLHRESNKENIAAQNKRYRENNLEKIKEKKKISYLKNREIVLEKQRIYRVNNKEQISLRAKNNPNSKISYTRWKRNNKERVKENFKLWQKKNLDKWRIYNANRKLRTRGILSLNLADNLKILQKNKCAVCEKNLKEYHLDHIMPLALGGENIDKNIQLLCPNCNLRKNAKHPTTFMQENGYLL